MSGRLPFLGPATYVRNRAHHLQRMLRVLSELEKIVFRTQVKMGRPMSEELNRMGDKDGEVRARMWATLAAQSDDAFERLTAYQRAIDALEDTPWMQVGLLRVLGF